jgi:hypothetical protein
MQKGERMSTPLRLDLDGLAPYDALVLAERLRCIAMLSTPTPADRRTARHLETIADALEASAA